MSVNETVSVSILDREFLVACAPGERAGLIAAAAHLDSRLREVRSHARGAALDRVALLTALNLSHELLELQRRNEDASSRMAQQLQALQARLDGAFAGSLQ
jgi:cell division protein ZapA